MTHLLKMSRGKLYAGLAFFGALILAITLILTNTNLSMALLPGRATGSDYQITLDSSNKVTSAGDHIQHTKKGSNVTFTYSDAANSTSGHVTLNSGGTLVNKDQITSLTAITATFSGTGSLKARLAYVNESSKWNEYFTLVSGARVETGSQPYYIELKADGGSVTITSALYEFSCVANPDAESQDTTGSYDITFKTNSSDSSGSLTSANIGNQITSGSSYISFSSVANVFEGVYGLKLSSSKNQGSMTFSLTNSVKYDLTSIVVKTQKWQGTGNADSTTVYIELDSGGSGKEASVSPSSTSSTTDLVLNIGSTTTYESITIYSTKRCYIPGITLNYGGKSEPGQPDNPTAYEVGFVASDANKDTYTTNSIFVNETALLVSSVKSDSTQSTLNPSAYSYEIRNSLNELIDPTQKFPIDGTYSLIVSYSTYPSQTITLNVGVYVYIDDIVPSVEQGVGKDTFTTADILIEHLANNLTATVGYSDDSSVTIAYNNFASNNIGVKLITPKGTTHDMTTMFGTEGNWKILVYRLDDETIKGDVKIRVNAIPVETITLNETSYELHPNGHLQLVTTLNPTNPTNDAIYFTSNNEDVATVDENGYVTAVAVGGATITAEAADGSGAVATCVITVTATPASVSDTLTRETTGVANNSTTYTNWSGKLGNSGAVYAGCSAGSHDAIQLRSNKSDSSIITTTSGGRIAKVSVEWNSETASERTLDIYGKNTAYESATDMYSSTYQGTKLGSIVCETSTEFTVTGDYAFVAVRSNSGAMYLDSITFTWGDDSGSSTPATPTYPTSISVTGTSSITIGETSQLTVGYEPSSTNVKNVTFSSNKENIATVSATGLVTGIAAGTARITASAQAAEGTVSNYIDIQVSSIAVTSISLNESSVAVKAGKTVTLTPTILPSNATNKTVTWSTSSSSIATVSGGVVTGVAAGEATITATTQDGNKTATCTVTVTAGSTASAWELVTDASTLSAGDVIVLASYANGVTNADISSQIFGTSSTTFNSDHTEIEELGADTVQLTLGGTSGNWTLSNDSGQLLGATAVKKLAWDTGTTTWTISISGGDATIENTNDSYGRFLYNVNNPRFTTYTSDVSSTMVLPQIYRGGTAEPTSPTSIIMSSTSLEMAPGGSKTLSVSYVPANANQDKDLTWTSSNTNVATVTGGVVNVKSTATAGQTATITAKLTNIPSITATCTITVVESQLDDHTVMIYMCGADLESGTDENGNVPSASNASGLASGDIDEILKVTGQPDDINIIIETGGANIWQSGHSFSISNSKLERWHVENRSLVKDETLKTYTSMGSTSTFQEFLQWGLTNYPAERTGVVLWNHGGGMHGVCYDETKSDDNLLNNEVKTAVQNAFNNIGRSTSDKLEWIGYDACLMSVQDICEFNSPYFKYQISSEESEAGYGWDYDNWVDELYRKDTTPTILQSICDTFISDNGGVNKSNGDQTLSYMKLEYMSAYKTAWENMAQQLSSKLTSSNKSTFNSAITGNVKHFADSDYDYFCLFDAMDFINKLASNSSFSSFRIDSSYTTAVTNAYANLKGYSTAQKGAGNAYGLCMYWPNSSQYSYISTYYTTSQTNFTRWQSLCNTYGTHR